MISIRSNTNRIITTGTCKGTNGGNTLLVPSFLGNT
uniref:Uncharacterized protein n=1 Tax=CrAss-like virus sp. ctt4r3 TaxID=2823619 RepID=A0A8S5L7B2_9CAUD|nr:MAG TPA: hypothetical protein [CrAss-like virus sp. ctt4r3]